MTKVEQKAFVRRLTNRVKRAVLDRIADGRIPPAWDGIELREYLFELFRRERVDHLLKSKRGRDYRNTVTCAPRL